MSKKNKEYYKRLHQELEKAGGEQQKILSILQKIENLALQGDGKDITDIIELVFLGNVYVYGEDYFEHAPQDIEKGIELFTKVLDMGSPWGAYNIAGYFDSIDNLLKQEEYYLKALNLGLPRAAEKLMQIEIRKGDQSQAKMYAKQYLEKLETAVAQQDFEALFDLIYLLLFGNECMVLDHKKALDLIHQTLKANKKFISFGEEVEQDETMGMLQECMAWLYYNGIDVDRDPQQAEKYLDQSKKSIGKEMFDELSEMFSEKEVFQMIDEVMDSNNLKDLSQDTKINQKWMGSFYECFAEYYPPLSWQTAVLFPYMKNLFDKMQAVDQGDFVKYIGDLSKHSDLDKLNNGYRSIPWQELKEMITA